MSISLCLEEKMNSLNSILIEGNVVRAPVMRETPRGSQVCTFSLASNRFYRQDDQTEQETSFFEIETWSKLAEICHTNCGKGRGIRVVGRLKQDRWVGADGKNYSKIKVVGEHIEFKPIFKGKSDVKPDLEESSEIEKLALEASVSPDLSNLIGDSIEESIEESEVSQDENIAVF